MKTSLSSYAAAFLTSAVMAAPADAATQSYDFTINAGPSGYTSSSTLPYGLPENPVLKGRFAVDAGILTDVLYKTGTMTWTLADVTSYSFILNDSDLTNFDLRFSSGNYVISNNTAQVNDGANYMFCNGCVSFAPSAISAVPEPATWALMILGFGAVGGAMRRRQQVAATVRFAI